MNREQLNAVYSSPSMKRRYEVWFLRCGLADGSGAWWFRYLLMNLGRARDRESTAAKPGQVWATWFPHGSEPQSFIQGFGSEALEFSERGALPFYCRIGGNGMEEGKCWGNLRVDGRRISWNLQLKSNFGATLSDKGWIGFSRSPHSDAKFSGEVELDGQRFAGEPLGFGVQGHNCGYRHRTYWRWMHACFVNADGVLSTLEALVYDMPLGMVFRNAILWHDGSATVLHRIKEAEILREPQRLRWVFAGSGADGTRVEAEMEGAAPGVHVLPYTKTDLSGTFPVSNASVARATVRILKNGAQETLQTAEGAVLEMGGV